MNVLLAHASRAPAAAPPAARPPTAEDFYRLQIHADRIHTPTLFMGGEPMAATPFRATKNVKQSTI